MSLLLAFSGSSASFASVAPPVVKSVSGPSGFVRLQVSGPPGASVVLGERVGPATTILKRLTLTSSAAVVDRVAPWRCSRRDRVFVAILARGDGPAVEGATTVKTPTCSRRVAVRVPSATRRGRTVVVRLRDRWITGGLGARVCVKPPGGRPSCRRTALPAESRPVTFRFRARRIGRWAVRTTSSAGQATERFLAVRPRRGVVRLLTVGDSQMQLLDQFLAGLMRSHGVRLRQRSDARISTGLSNSSFFDWPPRARSLARAFRPDVSVVFLGANDGFPLPTRRGRRVACCGTLWVRAYARRVDTMMASMLRGGQGRVYWVLLPVPRDRQVARYFRAVNAGIRLAAARHRGEARLIDTNATFAPGGVYRTTIVDRGRTVTVRDPDGYHLSVAGTRIAAREIVETMRRDRVVAGRWR